MGFRDIGSYLKKVRLETTNKIQPRNYPQKTVINRIENNENYMIKSLFGYLDALNHHLCYKNNALHTSADLGEIIKKKIESDNIVIAHLGKSVDLRRKTIYMLMSGHGNYHSFLSVLEALNIEIDIKKTIKDNEQENE